MIAVRRSQIAIRSAIVCDHMETYFCNRLGSYDHDRRRSQKIEHKGCFPYDRGSQIAIRSAIVCDHMETYFCDRLRPCNRDRRRSQKIQPCSISCDRLRSPAIIAIVRSCGNQSFAIRDRNASHNISGSLPRFNARVFDCRNGVRSNNHFAVISRNLWTKLIVMNVFTIAAAKILKTRTKGTTVGTKSGRSFIYRPGKRRPNFAT